MKNAWQQDINRGDYVYRGARDGNSSSYKMGLVRSVDEPSGKCRVYWLLETSFTFRLGHNGTFWQLDCPVPINTYGSPSIHSLVKIDRSTFIESYIHAIAVSDVKSELPTVNPGEPNVGIEEKEFMRLVDVAKGQNCTNYLWRLVENERTCAKQ